MDVQAVMSKAKRLAKDSGRSYHDIGVSMGYPPAMARQSVSAFLNGRNPTLAKLIRFARAMGMDARDLL